MAGLRIQHPTARNGFFTFEFSQQPLVKYSRSLKRKVPTPWYCLMCKREHVVKTIHLKVDAGGFAFVSKEVWKAMQKHNTAGFTVSNEVPDPPQTIVGMQPFHADVTEIKE
jgi:hypothetical protein